MHPKYIDIHSHINFTAFDEDREEVIGRALDNDTWMINVGTQADTSQKAIELAHKYKEGVYATIGLHPIHTDQSFHDKQELGPSFAKASDGQGRREGFVSRGEIFDKNIYREYLEDPKVVALGECGLDYFRLDENSIEKQKKAFIEQIELANEINKPLMIHVRNSSTSSPQVIPKFNAYLDVLEILKQYAKVPGVIHFFEGSWEIAKSFLALGFLLSFTGVITYPPRKNIKGCDYDEIIKNIPLDMILSDTDSPYIAPVPYRGKRNEPSYVKEIVKKIAEIKNLPEQAVAEAIVANAKRIFRI
jgi:TatD DNase family protein